MPTQVYWGKVVLLLLCWTVALSAEDGWKPLFNGKDLEGWEHVGQGKFIVENRDLKTVGGMGLLWYTRKRFGNAIVRIVYQVSELKANSGVFIRIPEKPKDPWFPVHFGYEVQINDGGDEFHRTGSIYSMSAAKPFPPSNDRWNTMEIQLDGIVTTISVNGHVVNTFDGTQTVPPRKKWFEPRRGPRPESGYSGLQNHDDRSTVWFKEVSVRPLRP